MDCAASNLRVRKKVLDPGITAVGTRRSSDNEAHSQPDGQIWCGTGNGLYRIVGWAGRVNLQLPCRPPSLLRRFRLYPKIPAGDYGWRLATRFVATRPMNAPGDTQRNGVPEVCFKRYG